MKREIEGDAKKVVVKEYRPEPDDVVFSKFVPPKELISQ
jgi:hypothetical protein